MACLLVVLYGNPERAANGKSTVCYGQPLQVAVGALFYSLKGNTNPPDCEANEICLKILSLPSHKVSKQYSNYGLSRAVLHLVAWSMGRAESFF